MYRELTKIKLPDNIFINPEVINKKIYDGSLAKGIYSNLYLAFEKCQFTYFIILSSRNLFYNKLNTSILDKKQTIFTNIDELSKLNHYTDYTIWHWSFFKNSKLVQYYRSIKNVHLYSSCHEGLTFHYHVCENIISFLEENKDIKDDLFEVQYCVEEFALQTIAMYEVNPANLYYGFFNINKTVDTSYTIPTDPDWYVYKTIRT